jgi:SAM-dependent methyltransferase
MSSIFRRFFYALSYLGNPPWDTGISPPELLEFLASHSPGRALDLGCGTGTNLITLAEHGWQVNGIDFSASAVRSARRRMSAKDLKGQVWQADVTHQLPVIGQFDLILDIGCYHDLSAADRCGYRENVRTRLAKSGTFLIYAHCLSPEKAKATGVSQVDIIEFATFLKVKSIVQTKDQWDRNTTWMTFINPV